MSDPVFRSKLCADFEAFISQKRASGYPYNTSAKVLGYLDTMIAEDYPDSSTLSKEICDAWIRKCSALHQNTLLRRVTPVRQFAKYLVGTGKSAYIIPGGIPRKQIRYDAHIFTEAELKSFFASIDSCKKSPFSPLRCYVIPVIFRLIYTCGLRASEARLLRTDDMIFLRERFLSGNPKDGKPVLFSPAKTCWICYVDMTVSSEIPILTGQHSFRTSLEIITVNLLWMYGSMNSGIRFQKQPWPKGSRPETMIFATPTVFTG